MRTELARRGVGMLAAQPLLDGLNCLRLLFMNPEVDASDISLVFDQLEDIGEGYASTGPP